ncbi:MAG TPA: cytochrome d ubiquinol oxidase subunit II [Polyangiaceae bacterium]|jgi:cytochrome d ubiquinol oxidase subunit II|nr:cytochrome d ubiquinol oxidase subunit II [Polyangiaceae bacterium]
MAEVWFSILALTLVLYAALDGFDFGAGLVHLWVARTDDERRAVLAAIGPFWDGNEVWLLATGGVLFVAFPSVLAVAFPAFYLALFLVLWCLVLRGISIEVRNHLEDSLWAAFFDAVFAGSSSLLALLFGLALGNVVRGVPIDANRSFTLALFTDFLPTGQVGLIDFYTLSVGLLSSVFLAAYGATFLAARTGGSLRVRCLAAERNSAFVAAALFVIVTIETHFVRPSLLANLLQRVPGWLGIAVLVAGASLWLSGFRAGRDRRAFIGSSLVAIGILGAAAAGLYPTIIHSTLAPEFDLNAPASLVPPYGAAVGLVWWLIALVPALLYVAMGFRRNWERVGRDPATR